MKIKGAVPALGTMHRRPWLSNFDHLTGRLWGSWFLTLTSINQLLWVRW